MTELKYSVNEVLNQGLMRKFTFAVNTETLQKEFEQKLLSMQKTYQRPGFRAGKVSLSLLKNFKEEDVQENLLQSLVKDIVQEFIRKNDFTLFAAPNLDITTFALDKGLDFTIDFELLPQVPHIDIDTLFRIAKEKCIPTDKDIENEISNMRQKAYDLVEYQDTHQAIKDDTVKIDFKGTINNKTFAGCEAKDFSFTLGKNNLLPEFSQELIGIKKGDTKTIFVTFPDNYTPQNLAKQTACFQVKVKNIYHKKQFTDEESLLHYLKCPDLKTLQDIVRDKLRDESEKIAYILAKRALFDQLEQKYTFEVPQSVVKRESELIAKNKDSQDNAQDIATTAQRRVKLGMLLLEYSKKHNISINEKDILILIKHRAKNNFELQYLLNSYQHNKQLRDILNGEALEEKVTQHILHKITDEKEGIAFAALKEQLDKINE